MAPCSVHGRRSWDGAAIWSITTSPLTRVLPRSGHSRGSASTALIKVRGHSPQGHTCGGEMDEGGEALVSFIVAGCNTAVLFEVTEEVLDQVTPAIHYEIAVNRCLTIGLWWNNSTCATSIKFGSKRVVVETFVADESVEGDPFNQRRNPDTVVALARKQDETGQIAEPVDKSHDLGGQATARTPDRLVLAPPLAPVACWWTRTMVPSTMAYSKSGSPERTVNTRSKTPFCAQRRKRRNTEFQGPKCSGRSRQGAPTRAIHSTASMKRRLSAPERPGSPGFPGRWGATRSHIESLKLDRSIVPSTRGLHRRNLARNWRMSTDLSLLSGTPLQSIGFGKSKLRVTSASQLLRDGPCR